MTYTKEQKIQLIQEGFELLNSNKGYSQADVVDKLTQLKYSTSRSVFNRVIKNNEVSKNTLPKIFIGMSILLKKELCMMIDQNNTWIRLEGGLPEIVQIPSKDTKYPGFIFHPEGRLEIQKKVNFFMEAREEMFEVGLTLNTFSSYFVSRRTNEFKKPILTLLERGVNIKCYLLDPKWNGTALYFSDRESTIKESLPGIDKIKSSLRKLKIIYKELDSLNLKGKVDVFTYRHIPHNYFLAIDPKNSLKAKMMISNYLFGQRRADCPVFEFTRKDQPILFQRYNDSLNRLTNGAKRIDFSKINE